MKYIAHRGNINGKSDKENSPDYINEALQLGYDVEIDVWIIDDKIFLGHDKPQYEITIDFLKNEQLWCHAKNLQALYFLLSNNIHCFWHQNDDFTITSKGFIWTYPGKELTSNSICVMPEWCESPNVESCFGVCSDYVLKYKNK